MRCTEEGDHTLVVISGDMDMTWLQRNQSALDELIASQPKKIVLDLSNVTFLDSIGLGVLARCIKVVKQQSMEGEVSVVGAGKQVSETIHIAGLDRHLATG